VALNLLFVVSDDLPGVQVHLLLEGGGGHLHPGAREGLPHQPPAGQQEKVNRMRKI